jgi:hypothetical protein
MTQIIIQDVSAIDFAVSVGYAARQGIFDEGI